jgi:hypothetical protein
MSGSSNLSPYINLEFLRKEAKSLLKRCRAGEESAMTRVRRQLRNVSKEINLADIHQALAREYGYSNWAELKRMAEPEEEFLSAIREPMLQSAKRYLGQFPAMARRSIHAACAIGNPEALTDYLKTDPSRATLERGGWSPLMYSCASPLNRLSSRQSAGIVECVSLLLDAGVDPDKMPAARQALATGKLGVYTLIERGSGSKNDFQEFMNESRRNDPILFDAFSEQWSTKPQFRHWIAEQRAEFRTHFRQETLTAFDPLRVIRREMPVFPDDAVGILRTALQRGYDPNQINAEGETWFHSIARIGNAAAAELFLAHGANPDAQSEGCSAFVIATRAGNKPFARILEQRGASTVGLRPIDELLGACLCLDRAKATSILKNYPDVLSVMSREDFEVMIQATAVNNLDQVKLMAEMGFDLAGQGEAGATALHIAAWHGHVDMVRLLLKLQAPLSALDIVYEGTPLNWAVHGSKHNRAFLLSRPDAMEDYRAVIAALQR